MTTKTALIIDDDEASAKLLGAVCEKLGIAVAGLARDGKEGLEKARALKPDLILLDLLLPGLDGFKVAEGVRAANLGCALAVVSGVYRDAKVARELADRFSADFFAKPLKVDGLEQALARRLGLTAIAPGPSPRNAAAASLDEVGAAPIYGSLRAKGFAALLMELSRARATGVLELERERAKKRLFLDHGQVRFAQSNLKSENVGGMQVAEGALSEEALRHALGRARAERAGVGEVLVAEGHLTPDGLVGALRRQVQEVCVTAFAWQEGTYRFDPGPMDAIRDVHQDPLSILLSAFKRYLSPEQARGQIAPWAEGTAARGPEFDRALFTLRAVFAGETLTPLVNGRLTVKEIVARARREDLPLLVALLQLELAAVAGLSDPARSIGARPAAAPPRPYTPEEEAARSLIAAEHQRVMNAPHLFAVLKVNRGAGADEVRAAYLPLAKRFHADSYSGLSLGDAQDKLRELFARVAEAYATLGDPRLRPEYDVFLERQEAGLPTDVEVIFKAEAAHARGDALMKQGRFTEAEAAVKEALKLDGSVAQYHSALGLALLRGRGASGLADARASFEKALALNPDFIPARLGKASALQLEGELRAAEKLLRDVLLGQPDHVEASRQLRALRELAKRDEGKGLLGRLFRR
jgi:curved DNA-binding protein CbpA/CheY-like chemotaxis protein